MQEQAIHARWADNHGIRSRLTWNSSDTLDQVRTIARDDTMHLLPKQVVAYPSDQPCRDAQLVQHQTGVGDCSTRGKNSRAHLGQATWLELGMEIDWYQAIKLGDDIQANVPGYNCSA
jgi:hypothetical protein